MSPRTCTTACGLTGGAAGTPAGAQRADALGPMAAREHPWAAPRRAPVGCPPSVGIQRPHALRCRAALAVTNAILIVAALLQAGCGYSLAGRGSFLPAHIKIIGVPPFVNHTPVFEIEQKITAKVQAELIGRGRYEVKPDRQNVDAVLLGEIQAVALAPAAFNDQQQATRYALTIVAKIEFRDLKTDKVLWANPALAFSEQYRRRDDADRARPECVPRAERQRDGTAGLGVCPNHRQRHPRVFLSVALIHTGRRP